MENKPEKQKYELRAPKMWEAISPVFVMVALFAIATYLKMDSTPMLVAAAIFAGFIAKRCGMTWAQMEKSIAAKVEQAMPAEMILIVVGMLIASWMFAGTIPMIIYYGVQLISAKYILVSTFVLCAIFSLVTGTSWGSAGTAGLAMMSIANGMGVNLAAVAGAAYAGAIFGDKLSPLSDTTILASLIAEQDIFKHIKHMLYTTVPAALIGLVFYFIIGSGYTSTSVGIPENTQMMLDSLGQMFHFNFIMLIPLLIVVYGAVTKKPSVLVMLLSSASAILIGVTVQGLKLSDGVNSLMYGFDPSMVSNAKAAFDVSSMSPDAARLITRGGMMSMMEALLVSICCYCFAGVVEETGCLKVALSKLMAKVDTTVGLIGATAFSAFLLAGIGGNTYISILMGGQLFRQKFIDKGLSTLNMSRTLEDAGTMTIGLFPWTSSGVYYAGIFGVATLKFAPYAIMCYLCVVIALILAATGFGIKKLEDGYTLQHKELDEMK